MTVLAKLASPRRAVPIEGWKTREHTLECGAAVLHLRSFNRKLGPVELVETYGRARPVSMPPYVVAGVLVLALTLGAMAFLLLYVLLLGLAEVQP